MINGVLQFILGVIVVLGLFVVGFFVYNREFLKSLRDVGAIQRQVDILVGVRDFATVKNEVYVTNDPSNGAFLELPLSQNQMGGAEFTYNFWLYKDPSIIADGNLVENNTTDGGLLKSDVVLFMRGESKVYDFKRMCTSTTDVTKKDVLVKCPLVKLQSPTKSRKLDVLTVELNTQTLPEAVHELAADECATSSKDWSRKNSHTISLSGLNVDNYNLKWFMVTIIMQDTFPKDPLPFRNKVHVRIYVNGILAMDRYVDNTLAIGKNDPTVVRQNNGHFYVAPELTIQNGDKTISPPSTSVQKIQMANLSYWNHALEADAIQVLYKKQFEHKPAVSKQTVNTSVSWSTDADVSLNAN